MTENKNEVVNRIKEKVAEALMNFHGYKRDDSTAPHEWDLNDKNSQYAMMYEDADIAVDTAISELLTITDDEDGLIENDYLTPSQSVTTSTAMFIFCDAGIGNPLYVKDVRQWLAAVDRAGIPNDTEVEGKLHLSYDIRNNPILERIECGECGHQDVLITEHWCKAIEEHEYKNAREEGTK